MKFELRLKYILLDKCNKVLKKRAEKRKKLPREIVYKCIDYYEKHDVFLKLDRAYFEKKKKLFGSKHNNNQKQEEK